MAYQLKEVTLRIRNLENGMEKISEVWQDVVSGKLPLLFDSQHVFQQGLSPVSRYSNYETDESGDYDLTIMGVQADFFQRMEEAVSQGFYKKYEEADEDISTCTRRAWEKVWAQQKAGEIHRSFTEDYESSVPAEYTKDGKAHCYLYIAVV